MRCVLAFTVVLAASGAALADSFNGAGFAIPDFANNTPGMASSDVSVPASFGNIEVIQVSVDLSHTWSGDVIVTLTHVDSGVSVDLVNRVGRTGDVGAGDSSNYDGVYSFADGASGDLWTEATIGGTSYVLTPGGYKPTTADNVATTLDGAYVGTDGSGTWRLTVSDNAGQDTGSLAGWTLTMRESPTPAPGAAAVLGLAGLVGLRRRR